MKYLLTLAAMLLSITASAQWTKFHRDADELNGTSEHTSLQYNSGKFIFSLLADDQFAIKTEEGIFDYEYVNGVTGCQVLVGLYREDGTLLEKFKIWLDKNTSTILRTRNAGTMFNPVGQAKKCKKLSKHLRTTTGYARIIAPRHEATDYDIKIPHIDMCYLKFSNPSQLYEYHHNTQIVKVPSGATIMRGMLVIFRELRFDSVLLLVQSCADLCRCVTAKSVTVCYFSGILGFGVLPLIFREINE